MLSLEVVVAGIVYLLFPAQNDYPPRLVEDGWNPFFRLAFHLADTINLEHNNLPSLHVALSMTAALSYARNCGSGGKAFYYIWTMLIVASSMLMHEHHLADVVAGGLLAGLGMAFVYPVLARRIQNHPRSAADS